MTRRLLIALMLVGALAGCTAGGIGNRVMNNTSNSVNVIVQGETPIQVLDQAGNWIDVGDAEDHLLAARGILYVGGRYQYLGPEENARYIK